MLLKTSNFFFAMKKRLLLDYNIFIVTVVALCFLSFPLTYLDQGFNNFLLLVILLNPGCIFWLHFGYKIDLNMYIYRQNSINICILHMFTLV